jgi:hypothetical protein
MVLDVESEGLAAAYLAYVQPLHFSPEEGRTAGLLNDAAHVGLLSSDALVLDPLRAELSRTDLVLGGTEYRLTLSLKARAAAADLADRLGVGRDRIAEVHAAAVRVGLKRLQPPKRGEAT